MAAREPKKTGVSVTGKDYLSRLAKSVRKKIKQRVLRRKRFLRVW
jgi:hypothetical protein